MGSSYEFDSNHLAEFLNLRNHVGDRLLQEVWLYFVLVW